MNIFTLTSQDGLHFALQHSGIAFGFYAQPPATCIVTYTLKELVIARPAAWRDSNSFFVHLL